MIEDFTLTACCQCGNILSMKLINQTLSGAKFTDLILETFRLNGALIAAGDQLVEDLGLTSARWQVLGALTKAPATVADIARVRGLTRQSVQRIADRLVLDGFLKTKPNLAHSRAKLYELTAHGETAMKEVARRHVRWSNEIAQGVGPERLADAASVMALIMGRLVPASPEGSE
jgi:DNA-binding MarR family transcriptional regulator